MKEKSCRTKKSRGKKNKPIIAIEFNDFMKRDCERIERQNIQRIIDYQDFVSAALRFYGLTK